VVVQIPKYPPGASAAAACAAAGRRCSDTAAPAGAEGRTAATTWGLLNPVATPTGRRTAPGDAAGILLGFL
jgi:hypothetical protein